MLPVECHASAFEWEIPERPIHVRYMPSFFPAAVSRFHKRLSEQDERNQRRAEQLEVWLQARLDAATAGGSQPAAIVADLRDAGFGLMEESIEPHQLAYSVPPARRFGVRFELDQASRSAWRVQVRWARADPLGGGVTARPGSPRVFLAIDARQPKRLWLLHRHPGPHLVLEGQFTEVPPLATDQDWHLGFFDWLRGADGQFLGLRLWMHDDRLGPRSKLAAAVPGALAADEVFDFVFVDDVRIDPAHSVDQGFDYTALFESPDGQLRLVVDGESLTDADIATVKQLARPPSR